MKPTITWIVIADGNQARIFEHDGPGRGLRPLKDLALEQEPLKAGEIMADRPGRTASGATPGARAAMEYRSDPVAVRERRFAGELAALLNDKHAAGRFDRLVIAAAPAALGDIRPALADEVRQVILAEIPKDLTNVPLPHLGPHFEGLIAI